MSGIKPARVAIVGCGAIGGFYGVMLARAGLDVHFLLRSEYDAVAARGLHISSRVHGELQLENAQAYASAQDMPACDWVLVGAKTTANAELATAINQVAAREAKVVLLQNGLGVEDALRPALRPDVHLLAGLCYICAHREAPGVVVHQALGAVNLAYHSGPLAESGLLLAQQGAEMFQQAGLESKAMDNLEQTRWQKLVWNVPFNGLSALLDANTRELMGQAASRALVADIMQEVVDAGAALGQRMPEDYAQKLLAATDRMPDYLPSMYHDFKLGREAELEAIYARPLAVAAEAGMAMPKVQALYQSLQFLQARRGH